MIDQEEIRTQCLSNDPEERLKVLDQLRLNFLLFPNKQQAWNDLIRLTIDQDSSVRRSAAKSLYSVFPHVPDKEKAWEDLHRLTNDKDRDMRMGAIVVFISSFSQLPNRQQAWNDLHRLLSDEDVNVRMGAIAALRHSFSEVPDQQQAWKDLHRLTNDKDSSVRGWAANILSFTFSQLLDKQQAWEDLHRLTSDQDSSVRRNAAKSFGSSFSHMPKEEAWKDLHRLTTDDDSDVRWEAALAFGSAFFYVFEKQQAWSDLCRLTNDDSNVRCGAALALGSAFACITDKERAFENLCRLTTDEDWIVRSYANHSLGKISILKASQAQTEENYRKKLESAIEFFENASERGSSLSISQFCLPFYRSFYTIIFKKQDANEEVNKYLAEAREAIENSKSKELLFEAVENLANALKEVQNLGSIDLETKKCELNFYRKYCDRAAELMRETEKTAPFATATLKRGLPILDRNLKELLEEIQKKTEVIRKQTKGTPFEKLGYDLNEGSLSLLQVRDLVGFKKQVQNLENKLSSMCSKLPEGQKDEACELLKTIHEEHSIEDKIPLINDILSKFSYQLDMITCVSRIDASLSSINKKVEELIIISRPGISEEIVISTGFQLAGSGFQHSIVIPLQEISYSELQEDLKQIRGKTIDKLSKLPKRLANKVNGYLLLHDEDDILEKLT
ncbi:HEAT repeat domain-containing protein [Methanosarcina soligelidi]|uniref:HEAT repeat domain-containing protein n=1 Tax=Methanosarcina soligelidi TaxID=1036677 RepID=UPI00069E928B|nr:HEAT repeat domain-containing protein [Methanosarcina soligelidi]